VIQIIRSPIQIESLVNQLRQPEDGAVVVFDGIVRNHSLGRETLYLEYESYEPMALKKMEEIETSARSRWPVNRIGIVHRLGRLEIGEASVAIVVTSAHRKAAFEACQYVIDTLKKTVPIWKKEFFVDGEVRRCAAFGCVLGDWDIPRQPGAAVLPSYRTAAATEVTTR
jgi:MoaE-MoaD fusion protein